MQDDKDREVCEMTVDEARMCQKHMEEHIKAALDVFISRTKMIPDVTIETHICTNLSRKVSIAVSSDVRL